MAFEELQDELEKMKIKEPTIPFEEGYNMAVKHAIELVKIYERRACSRSRADYPD